jgi:hypothetical protein
MKFVEIYLQNERYNPRIKATVSGAWVGVLNDGREIYICADYQAKSAAQAKLIYQEEQDMLDRFDVTNRIDR